MKDLFITLEGGEGSGKSCQIKRLDKFLKQKKIPHILTREPGGTPLADKLRKVLLVPSKEKIAPLAELLMYEAARAQHVEKVIRPALKKGKLVLCDRFFDSTTVYQGVARGLDLPLVEKCNQIATGGLNPKITIIIDVPVSVGLKRANGRMSKKKGKREDRFEKENLAFHNKIRNGFLKLAKKKIKGRKFYVVDGTKTEIEVFEQIKKVLGQHAI